MSKTNALRVEISLILLVPKATLVCTSPTGYSNPSHCAAFVQHYRLPSTYIPQRTLTACHNSRELVSFARVLAHMLFYKEIFGSAAVVRSDVGDCDSVTV
jgi:hypothetical protein